MKKTVLAILLCAVAAAAQAQWNDASSEAHLKNLGQKQQDQANKFSETVDHKVALSSMKIGKYTFELRGETDAKENAGARQISVHKYFYRPKNGPAVFRESLMTDDAGKFHLISNPASLLVGPLHWQYADYTVSMIEVTVYPGERMGLLKNKFKQNYGQDCIHEYAELRTWPVRTMDVFTAPIRAFYVPSKNQTVEIKALVTSQQTGTNYPRDCRYNAPGVLYRKFINGTDSFINKWKK